MKENQTVGYDRKSNNNTFTVYFIKLYDAAGIQNISIDKAKQYHFLVPYSVFRNYME